VTLNCVHLQGSVVWGVHDIVMMSFTPMYKGAVIASCSHCISMVLIRCRECGRAGKLCAISFGLMIKSRMSRR
jgi:hypothetical protein